MHNIERLQGKAHYTGYAGGVWHITKTGRYWEARRASDNQQLFARTLKEISKLLDRQG